MANSRKAILIDILLLIGLVSSSYAGWFWREISTATYSNTSSTATYANTSSTATYSTTSATATYATTGGTGDNLGNHTATTNIALGDNSISNVDHIEVSSMTVNYGSDLLISASNLDVKGSVKASGGYEAEATGSVSLSLVSLPDEETGIFEVGSSEVIIGADSEGHPLHLRYDGSNYWMLASTGVVVSTDVTTSGYDILTDTMTATKHGLFGGSTDVTYDLTGNAVSQWKLNDNAANTTVTDTIGSNDGVSEQNTNVVSSTDAKQGTAFDFEDATADYVTIADAGDNLEMRDTDHSISAWFKIGQDDAADTYDVLFARYSGGNGYIFCIYKSDDLMYYYNAGCAWRNEYGTQSALNDDTWHHGIVVVDIDVGITFYRDGVLSGDRADTSSNPNALAGGTAYIGAVSTTYGEWDGLIDNVVVYNKALSRSEVVQLYEAGRGLEVLKGSAYVTAVGDAATLTPSYVLGQDCLYVEQDIDIGGKFYTDNDANFGADVIIQNNQDIKGDQEVRGDATFYGLAEVQGLTLSIADQMNHLGDADTYLAYGVDYARLTVGGVHMFIMDENGTDYISVGADMYPASDDTLDLGTSSNGYNYVYVSTITASTASRLTLDDDVNITGDVDINAGTIYTDSATGNIGLGISSGLDAKLDVYNTGACYAEITGTGDAYAYSTLTLESDEATDKQWFISHRTDVANLLNIISYNGSTYDSRFSIELGGQVGIGDTSPSQALDVNGDVRADSYIEYSPIFVGDATGTLVNIQPAIGTVVDGWGDVDHSTLPSGLTTTFSEKWIRHKLTKEEIKKGHITDPFFDYTDWEEFDKEITARDMGRSVQYNLRAVKQLYDYAQSLEARIAALEASPTP